MSAASLSSFWHMLHMQLAVSSLTSPISFPHMCIIGTAPTYSLDTTATVTNSTTSSPNIDFGTNFSNPDATGRKMSGSVRFTVYANAQCNYALTSAYGALKNITAVKRVPSVTTTPTLMMYQDQVRWFI